MADSTYLLFKLYEFLYGVETAFIHEIVELPELQSMAEMPPYLVGLFDLHGEIIHVIDLGVCLGYSSAEQYSLEDLVVILKGPDFCFGFIVSSIVNIASLSHIHPLSPISIEEKPISFFASKVAKYEELIVFILDPTLLIKKIEILADNSLTKKPREAFKVKVKEEDQLAFSIRTHKLKQPIVEIKPVEGLIPLTVITLDQEIFGVDPEIIKEFLPLGEFTPIPHADEHLLGFVNFRGTVLTLIDIWPILKMQKLKITSQTHFLIVGIDQLTVGIIVDKIVDLLYLHPSDFQSTPIGIEETSLGAFTTHTVFYGKDFLNVLDVAKILESMLS